MVPDLATKDDPMTKLSDTQVIILSAAAQRPDGNVLPLPGSPRRFPPCWPAYRQQVPPPSEA